MRGFYIILQVFALLLVFGSCKKEKDPVPGSELNFKASKNDVSWKSTTSWASYSAKEQKFYISASKRDSKYYQEEVLGISFTMPDLTKPLTTNNFSSEWYYIIGGDAVSDRYTLDGTSANNQIQITSVDTEKKIITGKFSIRLIHDSWYSDKGETFQFSSGYFSVSYAELE